jgi:iron complex outermembrane receptor protein
VPTLVDTAFAGARSAGQRVTLRANATHRGGDDSVRSASFTMGVEQSFTRELAPRRVRTAGAGDAGIDDTLIAWSSTGLLVQGQASWHQSLFVQGGARVEYVSGLTHSYQTALLPMLGAAWVRELGPAALKLRGAYGRGIRPARVGPRVGWRTWGLGPLVEPEQQSGTEVGADLFLQAPAGARLALQATRFDQIATNLAQPVTRLRDSTCTPGPRRGPPGPCDQGAEYGVQNVGAIGNAGWELQATATRGALSLSSSLTLVDSRVRRLGAEYSGDLRVGDRMLEVPSRTAGLTAAWTAPRWSLSTTLARASDWRNYDRAALAAAYAQESVSPPVGAALRQFVRDYPGVTRLGATGEVTLWRATTLQLRAENLLDRQTGEPDNLTVLPGRSLLFGIRTRF